MRLVIDAIVADVVALRRRLASARAALERRFCRHADTIQFAPGRMYLSCDCCGRHTPGWVIDSSGPSERSVLGGTKGGGQGTTDLQHPADPGPLNTPGRHVFALSSIEDPRR